MSAVEASTVATATNDLSNFNDEQVKFMEEEYCIVVDNDDKVIGKETKKASTSLHVRV